MSKKEYNQISNITYKIQDLADKLEQLGYNEDCSKLYKIAQGIQDHRDEVALSESIDYTGLKEEA
jgi:succinylglutamate desuccinylase